MMCHYSSFRLKFVVLIVVCCTIDILHSFTIVHQKFTKIPQGISSLLSSSSLFAAKGFGENKSSQQQRKKTSIDIDSTISNDETKNIATSTPARTVQQTSLPSSLSTNIQSQSINQSSSQQQQQQQQQNDERLNPGQIALAKLRRERAEQKDNELRMVREMISMEEQSKVSAPSIPEQVAIRMGTRMVPFVGIPLFLGLSTFIGFWYMATYRDMVFQPALIASSTIVLLLFGLLGITYSVMSASWDIDREGSFIGFDEFLNNINNIRSGFTRTRENTILKDKMSQLSSDEIKKALDDLDQREKQLYKKKSSLETKIQDELK